MEDLKVTVGLSVKEAREKKNLSQADLAELIGASKVYISHLEQGRKNITLKQLGRIAEAMNIREVELILKTK